MKTFSLGVSAALICALSAPAFAADNWLACEGTVTTTLEGQAPKTEPVKETYAYNDETKNLFKYLEKSKSLSPMLVTAYNDKQITWGSATQSVSSATWEGKLDRAAWKLDQTRKERGETMVWAEQCKPTAALVK